MQLFLEFLITKCAAKLESFLRPKCKSELFEGIASLRAGRSSETNGPTSSGSESITEAYRSFPVGRRQLKCCCSHADSPGKTAIYSPTQIHEYFLRLQAVAVSLCRQHLLFYISRLSSKALRGTGNQVYREIQRGKQICSLQWKILTVSQSVSLVMTQNYQWSIKL